MEKALRYGADALILDLEDSVTPDAKPAARLAAANFLRQAKGRIPLLVRVNPLDSGLLDDDLAAILQVPPDGLVLPKAEGAPSVQALSAKAPGIPILPIATETPAAIFQLGSYESVRHHLLGLTWGAEDLPAAIGALGARDGTGRYTAPYELARSLTLFGAHAASVAAIETVYPALADPDGLAAYARRARFDGFNGIMAIHPAQVPVINQAFTPTPEELTEAQAIVDAFAASPGMGALSYRGRMIDAPHLKQARRVLELAADVAG
ncbi:citrate (pro-3S)-lyase [Agrobacterium albertimagni AOL15]|uniref:Citrate (Pro-3S)-lyase n=2 Tax=Agrobacterium albertimagni TaxID=147266 RepID=K2PJH0_9HYPH|nr:citrate (pro-3S)-lyase [Agrobacterium albertimagni AOL15]